MKITLTNVSGRNFLQYPSIEFPLDRQGLVFLAGELDHNRQRSNSAGKTAALSLISWVIWGTVLKDSRDVSSVINYRATSCTARLDGFIDDKPFWIERHRGRSSSELKASFAGSSRAPDVQAEIDKVFGTFVLAQNTIFLAQRKALEFLAATDVARRRILEELLKIGIWRDAQERVKADLEWAKTARSKLVYELESYSSKLEALRTDQEHKRELALADIRARVTITETHLVDVEASIPELDARYEVNKAQVKACADRANAANDELALLKKKLDAADAERGKHLYPDEPCPTCLRPFDPTPWYADGAQERLEEANRAYELALNAFALQKGVACSCNLEWNRHIEQGLEIGAWQSSARHRASRLDAELIALRKEEDRVQTLTFLDNAEDIVDMETKCANRKDAIQDLDLGVKAMEFWRDGFSFKGIPAMIINESLPMLVKQANEVLAVLSDEELTLDILAVDAARSGKALIDRLTFLVWKDGREIYMEDCSAGEQRRIVVAIFLALAKMQTTLTGTTWNIRLIDELFDELDPHGIERVMRVLRPMADEYTILVTSHRSELAGLVGFGQCWVARRGREGSVLHTT